MRRLLKFGWAVSDALVRVLASLDSHTTVRFTHIRQTCRHCGADLVLDEDGMWVDPEATGDDETWRATCPAHDTFVAEHEPAEAL